MGWAILLHYCFLLLLYYYYYIIIISYMLASFLIHRLGHIIILSFIIIYYHLLLFLLFIIILVIISYIFTSSLPHGFRTPSAMPAWVGHAVGDASTQRRCPVSAYQLHRGAVGGVLVPHDAPDPGGVAPQHRDTRDGGAIVIVEQPPHADLQRERVWPGGSASADGLAGQLVRMAWRVN